MVWLVPVLSVSNLILEELALVDVAKAQVSMVGPRDVPRSETVCPTGWMIVAITPSEEHLGVAGVLGICDHPVCIDMDETHLAAPVIVIPLAVIPVRNRSAKYMYSQLALRPRVVVADVVSFDSGCWNQGYARCQKQSQ